MHSLADLNRYSNQSITFSDERPYTLEFDNNNPVSSNVYAVEGGTISPEPATNITKIYNANANTISYTISVSDPINVTVTWPDIPTTLTFVANTTSGTYTIGNIMSTKDWSYIGKPIIDLKTDFGGNFNYTSTINFPGGSLGWVNSVITTDYPEMTDANTITYTANTTTTLTGTPSVVDTDNSSYTLIVSGFIYGNPDQYQYASIDGNIRTTATVGNVISAGLNADGSAVTPWTKQIRVQGTREQINTHLSSLQYIADNVNANFYLEYRLIAASGFVTRKFQRLNNAISANANASIIIDANIGAYQKFDENSGVELTSWPTLTDFASDVYSNVGSVGYTYSDTSISPFGNGANVVPLSASVEYNTWDNQNRRLGVYYYADNNPYYNEPYKSDAYAALRTAISSQLVSPPIGHRDYILLQVRYRHGVGMFFPETTYGYSQRLLEFSGVKSNVISNITVPRSFTTSTVSNLFPSSIPAIIENTSSDTVYTVEITTPAGELGLTDASFSSTWTMTGTKETINSAFANLKIYPYNGIAAGTYWFNYKQLRNGVLQESKVVYLIGYQRSTAIPGTGTFTVSAGTYTPTIYQRRYLKADILCVGGGGGGASISDLGGGGGGGAVVEILDTTLPNPSYTAVIGVGGLSGSSGFDNGGTTSLGSAISAAGGQAGLYSPTRRGGNSGSGYTGGNSSLDGAGGGGAGAGANGGNASGYNGGAGGAGKVSTIDGITYAGGGGGCKILSGTVGSSGAGASNAGGGGTWGNSGKAGLIKVRYRV